MIYPQTDTPPGSAGVPVPLQRRVRDRARRASAAPRPRRRTRRAPAQAAFVAGEDELAHLRGRARRRAGRRRRGARSLASSASMSSGALALGARGVGCGRRASGGSHAPARPRGAGRLGARAARRRTGRLADDRPPWPIWSWRLVRGEQRDHDRQQDEQPDRAEHAPGGKAACIESDCCSTGRASLPSPVASVD